MKRGKSNFNLWMDAMVLLVEQLVCAFLFIGSIFSLVIFSSLRFPLTSSLDFFLFVLHFAWIYVGANLFINASKMKEEVKE